MLQYITSVGGFWLKLKWILEEGEGCKALPFNTGRPAAYARHIYLPHYSAAVKRIHVASPLSFADRLVAIEHSAQVQKRLFR